METINEAKITSSPSDHPRLDGRALEGLRALEELARTMEPETEQPSTVLISKIETSPVLHHREELSERLIGDLVKVLDNGDRLPPITVLRVGGRTFVVDGHHRLEAHRVHASRLSQSGDYEVPVAYFAGSPAEAVFASIVANSRHGVRLTASERTDAAWKLVLIGEKNRTEIRQATGVARSWITKMRQVKRLLGDEAGEYRSWHRALQVANGRTRQELTEEEYEERKRMRAERIADQITRTIGKHSSDPELMAMAMEVVLGRKLGEFIRHLRELHYDPFEEDEEVEF